MIEQIIVTFLLFLGFFGILLLSEFIHARFGTKTEFTRKLSHVTASLSSLVFLWFIESHWYILFLGVFFFLLLFIGKRRGLFNSIDSVERKTSGSYLLPVAIYLLFMISDVTGKDMYFVIPLVIMGISDPIAGTIGSRYKHRTREIMIGRLALGKTYLGSLAFFLATMILSMGLMYIFGYDPGQSLIWSIWISITGTLVEMLSSRGLDNLTVPLAICLVIWFMM